MMKNALFIGALLCLGWAQVRSGETTTYSGDVCNNFYGYTCDRETPEFQVGPYETLIPQYQPESIKDEIENILKQDLTVKGSENITIAQYMYQTCMKMGSEVEEHLADSEFVKTIRRDGGCPMMMDSWTGSEIVQLLDTQKYYPSLFSMRVENHELYVDNYDMSVYGRFLSNVYGPKKMFNEAKYKELVKELIKLLAGKLGFQPKDDVLNKDVDDMMMFREKLNKQTNMMYETGYMTNVTLVNLDEIKNMMPSNRNDNNMKIDWDQFYHSLITHSEHNDVMYMDKTYIKGLMELLMATPPRTIMNHIKLHYIETHFGHISTQYREMHKQMSMAAYEHYVPMTDSEWCIKHTHINVPLAYNYLQKWFPRTHVEKSMKMIDQVKKHYQLYISKNTKLSPAEMTEMVKYINDIKVVIGAEEKYMDYQFLHPYMDMTKYSMYFDKMIHLYENMRQMEYDSLYNTKESISHFFDVTYTSPLMYPQHARIVIPMGYMHFHRMSPMLPAIYSYPTLGRAISELMSQMMCMKGYKNCHTQEMMPQRHMTPVYGPLESARCYVKQWCPEQGVSNQIYDTKYNYDCGSYYYWSKLGLKVAYDAYYDLLQTTEMESKFIQENHLDARTFFYMCAKENCKFMNQFPIKNVAQQKYDEMSSMNKREINTCMNTMEAFRTVFNCEH